MNGFDKVFAYDYIYEHLYEFVKTKKTQEDICTFAHGDLRRNTQKPVLSSKVQG